MKRTLTLLAAVVAILVTACTTQPTSDNTVVTLSVDDPATASCWTMGDSLFASDHYVVRVADLIPDVANVAVGGATLMSWKDPLGKPTNRIRDQLAKTEMYGWPRCVVIHGGDADAYAPTVGATRIDNVDFDVEIQYLTQVLESNGTHVYWANPIPPGFQFAYQDVFRQQVRDWLSSNMPERVIDCNPAVDLDNSGFVDPPFLYGTYNPGPLADYNHFSTAGAKKYGECLHQALVDRGELSN